MARRAADALNIRTAHTYARVVCTTEFAEREFVRIGARNVVRAPLGVDLVGRHPGLRDLGVRLSVDDFGTGYSSLSYLNRYPVTGVKVDRAFVDGLGDVPGDEAIVRAVTAMASALNLGVVAEGVETTRQRDILCKLGIEHGQGWLWGRAEPPETFELLWGPPTKKELQAKTIERAAKSPIRLAAPLPRGLAEAVAEATASSQNEEANS
jgi:EAL domain-containing protein (putative c-di-GMP-specific phosphodiesterase class I)